MGIPMNVLLTILLLSSFVPLISSEEFITPTRTITLVTSSVDFIVKPFSGCGGNVTHNNGSLHSPHYPEDSPNDLFCVWRLRAALGSTILLHFNYLSLANTTDCTADYVEVLDTSLGPLNLIGRYCGSFARPESVVSSTNEVIVRFRSNSTAQGRKFLITHSTITESCNKTLTDLAGIIESPSYPNYPNNLDCAWQIKTLTDQQISLVFQYFDIEYSTNCSKDSLEVWEQWNTPNETFIGKFCGYLLGKWLQSNGSSLYIRFKTDSRNIRRGFRLKYSAVKSGCNMELNNSAGIITSPPAGSNRVKCFWKVLTSNANASGILLTFDQFLLANTLNCSSDNLTIYDGPNDESPVIGKYCGLMTGETVISNGTSLYLKFYFSSAKRLAGFQIQYESVYLDCNKVFNATKGIIESPFFPYNYPNNLYCSWKIELPPGNTISITADEMDVEYVSNCTRDFLEIRDGSGNSAVLLGKFCGSLPTMVEVKSSSNEVQLIFVSNSHVTRKGFKIQYSALRTDCPRVITNSLGNITSPNYPDWYPNSYQCRWLITAEPGYQVHLEFEYFELTYTADCVGDYVEIIDGDSVENGTRMGKYCGYVMPMPKLVSKGNALFIRINTDTDKPARGFHLNYNVSGTGLPPPPRPASEEELNQAVKITVAKMKVSGWITNVDLAFKTAVSNATNQFCLQNIATCKLSQPYRYRREILVSKNVFNKSHVHLVPGFPLLSNNTIDLEVAFYVRYPSNMTTDSTVLSKEAVLAAMELSVTYISLAIGRNITNIEPYRPDSKIPIAKPSEGNVWLILGITITIVLVIVIPIIIFVIWLKKRELGRIKVQPLVSTSNIELKSKKFSTSELNIRKKSRTGNNYEDLVCESPPNTPDPQY